MGPFSAELEAILDRWTPRSRKLFDELMEDATSELQQELVQRAVLAGHTPGEVHAFADELRGLSDDECFDVCTVDDAAPEGYTVAQLLRAESDPLFAFELKGGEISPNDADDAPSIVEPGRREAMDVADDRGLAADPVRRAIEQRRGFNVDSGSHRATARKEAEYVGDSGSHRALQRNSGSHRPLQRGEVELGAGPVAASVHVAVPMAISGARFFEDLLAEATRGLGVTWKEQEIDALGGLTMDEVLRQAQTALSRGIPLPFVVGNAQAKPLKFVLMLQSSASGATRAYQLYEPFSQELVWANEKTLLSKGELPFDNKALRRFLRVALPSLRGL